MMWTQTMALFVDAYRELNSRKLFWVSLAISGIIVVFFAMLGIDEKGITILSYHLPIPVNSTLISPATFYKILFTSFGIGVWLSWGALILALVSTSGMIPELVTAGSVELILSRPLGRGRLLLTKFIAGLLFVLLQVTVFSLATILLIGIRGQEWIWGLLVAVPMVTLLFSYLFSICVLLGLWTRSAIGSLIFTCIIWLFIFLLNATEVVLLQSRIGAEQELRKAQQQLDVAELAIRNETSRVEAGSPGAWTPEQIAGLERTVQISRTKRDEEDEALAKVLAWHRPIFAIKTVLPKTSETTLVINRVIESQADLNSIAEVQRKATSNRRGGALALGRLEQEQASEREVRERPLLWVLGTSIAFEVLVLVIAVWIFRRRDF